MEPLQVILGGALFWFPGLTWTWALVPQLPWQHRIPLSVVAAFTIEPGALMALHLLFAVPITLATGAYLSAALGTAGLVVLVRRAMAETPQAARTGAEP